MCMDILPLLNIRILTLDFLPTSSFDMDNDLFMPSIVYVRAYMHVPIFM